MKILFDESTYLMNKLSSTLPADSLKLPIVLYVYKYNLKTAFKTSYVEVFNVYNLLIFFQNKHYFETLILLKSIWTTMCFICSNVMFSFLTVGLQRTLLHDVCQEMDQILKFHL